MLRFDLIVETDNPDTIRTVVNTILAMPRSVWEDPTFKASATIPNSENTPVFRQLAGEPDPDTFQTTYTTHSDGWTGFNTVEDAA